MISNQICTTYRCERSFHGHSLDVLKSGLQKYIRRGNIEGAMYCLAELDLFFMCDGGEKIRTNMIHRLMIIYMEDIGLGGIRSWPAIDKLVKKWLEDRSQHILLQKFVQIMCVSKKTRACSFARAFARKETVSEYKEEHALIKKYLEMLNQKSHLSEYKKAAEELTALGVNYMDIAYSWIKEVKTVERPLFFLFPLLEYLFGGFEVTVPRYKIDINWEHHKKIKEFKFDDYVFDKHTRHGKKDRDFFVHISSQVNNEVFLLPPCFVNAYVNSANEQDYELIVRCQLVCTHSKTDTVMALHPDTKKMVFLKGPFATQEPILFFLKMQEEKRQRNLPFVKGRMIMLVPNRWDTTPLGVRNTLDLNQAWPFLECEALFEEKSIIIEQKQSTHWPPTQVMDAKKMNLTIDPFNLDEQEFIDYVNALKFRLEFKIGDFADRNFIKAKDGRIYSIDEESQVEGEIDLLKCLKKRRYDLVKDYL